MQGIPQGSHQGGSQKPSLSWSTPAVPKPVAPQAPKTPGPKSNGKGGQEKSNMTTYVGIFVAGLIVGGLLGWAALGGHGAAGTTTTNTTGTTTQAAATTSATVDLTGSATAGGLQGLSIASGQEAGASVAIAGINVSEPTWVIIYDNESGAPGRALGAQLFFPRAQGGETSGSVSLIRNTLAGHSYLAGERIDNGDHAYDPSADHQTLGANGQPLTVSFTTK